MRPTHFAATLTMIEQRFDKASARYTCIDTQKWTRSESWNTSPSSTPLLINSLTRALIISNTIPIFVLIPSLFGNTSWILKHRQATV